MLNSIYSTDVAAILETSLLKCQKSHRDLESAKCFLDREREQNQAPFLSWHNIKSHLLEQVHRGQIGTQL